MKPHIKHLSGGKANNRMQRVTPKPRRLPQLSITTTWTQTLWQTFTHAGWQHVMTLSPPNRRAEPTGHLCRQVIMWSRLPGWATTEALQILNQQQSSPGQMIIICDELLLITTHRFQASLPSGASSSVGEDAEHRGDGIRPPQLVHVKSWGMVRSCDDIKLWIHWGCVQIIRDNVSWFKDKWLAANCQMCVPCR